MVAPHTDPRHFAKAVTEFGAVRPVVATHPIFSTTGVKIVDKGAALNPGFYERLMQHQLSSPLVNSVGSTASVTGRMLRNGAIELMRTEPLFALLVPEAAHRTLMLDVLERVPLPDPIAFQLTLACEARPDLYQHSLRSALVAVWLAIDVKMSRFNMNIAAAAGLLHDIGMLHLDPLLLDYKSDINRAQRRQLYSHPLVSAALIEVHPEFPREIVRAVMEHHEFLDGSGYPRNLAGSQISHPGRILALAELIVGAFAPGREAPAPRLSVLLRMNRHRYDEALAARVLAMLQTASDEASASASVSLLKDPVGGLLAIDGVLAAWPAHLADRSGMSPQRREVLHGLSGQVAQLHRTLARVGAAPQQLGQLGDESLDSELQTELSLLASEAAWQLRALARETGRRWRVAPDAGFPEELQQWLDRVVEVIFQVSGLYPAKEDRESDDE